MKIHVDPLTSARNAAVGAVEAHFNRLAMANAHVDSLAHAIGCDGCHPVEEREVQRQALLARIAAAPDLETLRKLVSELC